MLGQRIALAVEASVIELPMHRPQATLHRGQIVRLADRFLFPPVGVTLYGELAPAPVCAGLEEHFRLPGGAGEVLRWPQRLICAQYSPDHQQKRILPLLWLPALPGPGILAFAGVLALLLTRLRGTVMSGHPSRGGTLPPAGRRR
jgi:hypothetical protein